MQIDMASAIAVTPGPQLAGYPSLLGDCAAAGLAPARARHVLRQKVHAMVVLGSRNSRMKDYFDVRALLREDEMDAGQLARALAATFARRRTACRTACRPAWATRLLATRRSRPMAGALLEKNRIKGPALDAVMADIRARLATPLTRARAHKVDA